MKKLLFLMIVSASFLYSIAYAGEWVHCSGKNGYCSFSGQKKVKYGAGNRWHYLTLNNGTACHNNVFGDPAHGKYKNCYYYQPSNYRWDFCSKDKGKCKFSGKKLIKYGTQGRYSYKTLEDGAYCNTHVFGDPAHGKRKSCYVKNWLGRVQ